MAHHKRKGPKSTRAGCLLCKPQKRQGSPLAERQRFSQTRRLAVAGEKAAEQA
jgi:hypothetical protein